jgi:hypothetical protein
MQCTTPSNTSITCSGTGSCDSGSCGAPFPFPTGVGVTLACKQKPGSDTDTACVDQLGKPRKLDCSAAETAAALAEGCVQTTPGASDVGCPLSVSGS